jgi:hypothetical protein
LKGKSKEFDTDLTDLRDRFDKIESQLSNNVVSHPEVVDTKFKHSILDIDRLEQQLAYQEDRYLNISDEEQIKITDLPREKKHNGRPKEHLKTII